MSGSLLKNQMNGEVGFISRDLIDVKDSLDYKIRMNCGKLGVNISSSRNRLKQLVESTARDDSLELRNNVFNEFMKTVALNYHIILNLRRDQIMKTQ